MKSTAIRKKFSHSWVDTRIYRIYTYNWLIVVVELVVVLMMQMRITMFMMEIMTSKIGNILTITVMNIAM